MRHSPRTSLALVAWLTAAALAALPTTAGSPPGKRERGSKRPPLIDRETFFGDPEISGAQISPDGRWISFLKPYRNVLNIWVKKREEPFAAARPITADLERPVTGYFWAEDSRYVLYVQDKGGDENYHVYAVDPAANATGETGVPAARDLTPLDNVRAYIYALPERTPNQILVGLNDRDPSLHDVYRLRIDTGERELVIRNDQNVAFWVADLDGGVRLAWRQTPDGGSEILRVDGGTLGKALYTCSYEETCVPTRFHRDGRRVYVHSDKGKEVDLGRLLLLDADTGVAELVDSDPLGQVDFGGEIFSDATEELIGTFYVGDRVRIYPRTDPLRRDLAFLRKHVPDGDLSFGAATENDRLWIVSVSRDVNPGQVYLYDRGQRRVDKLYDSRPDLPSEHLAPMQPVSYRASDGVSIPAYLTLPKGVGPKNLPAIVFPHGGPWARDVWGYDPVVQFLANRGYAVLQPNFRGSSGYGKSFLNAGNRAWGTGVMQHDLTAAAKYLIDRGLADPKRVGIMGGSYGGYATLAGVTFTPELYAAGVSIVGPSSIITLLNSIPPYWGPIRKLFLTRVGDPDVPEDRRRLESQSPLYHATQIKAPLLVIQGANDPRVKKAESDQIVVALRDLKRPVDYMVAPDEGHGFAGKENRLAMFALIEEFLARHLGGRFQDGGPPEIAERIAALRVDVGTIELARQPQGADAARTDPLPSPVAGALAARRLGYSSTVRLPDGRELVIERFVELAEEALEGRRAWRVATSAQTPMGEARDVFHLDALTLGPLRRAVTQGPVTVALEFSGTAIHGSIKLPGGEMPVDATLDAPVFGDDAALEAVLAALPLDAGYRTTLRTFDIQMRKVRPWSLAVTGTESLEVPAGRFETFRTALEPLDGEGGGGTLWISRDAPRKTVRSEMVLPPQAGGGTVVTTLTSESRL